MIEQVAVKLFEKAKIKEDAAKKRVAREVTTLELTRGNCTSPFLRFQGEYTSKVEIPGRGVQILYSSPGLLFTIAPCEI